MNMGLPVNRPLHAPDGHPSVAFGKVGVLLVNLGSPDEANPKAVRRYLKQFLSDKRVVELPTLLWQPILRGIILTTRPKKTAANYAKIWCKDGNDSPLRLITARQAAALVDEWPGVTVDFAMRYGNPSIDHKLQRLREAGCDRILIAPLYPQYSSATTGTVIEAAWTALRQARWLPATRTLPPYHDDPAYIRALAESLREGLARLDFEPELIVASYHGMPRDTLDKGDPYHCHCRKTSRLLAEALGLRDGKLLTTFQSRFGRAEWLQPYTEPKLIELAQQGLKRVVLFCPGFAADCLETLEEIAIGAKEAFEHHGGDQFAYLPCLNDTAAGIDMLRQLIGQELAGWVRAG